MDLAFWLAIAAAILCVDVAIYGERYGLEDEIY